MVGLSLCSDAEDSTQLLRAIAKVRREVADNDDLLLVESVEDIRRACRSGRLAVAMNAQGTNSVGSDLNLVEAYYKLGVRQMLLVYNHKSRVGDGCHERTDSGLSRYGLELVAEMNRVGMLVDVSHAGHRTSMEAIDASSVPVVFSHSNPRALWSHDRNITDDQARACADKGGWVGVTGVGIFMGEDDASTQTVFRQIDHWVSLLGAEHVGLGTDFVYDPHDMHRYMAGVKSPAAGNYERMFNFFQPEQLPELVECMLAANYSEDVVRGIFGENYLRVAGLVWR